MTDDLEQAVDDALECFEMYELRRAEGQYRSALKWYRQGKGKLEVAVDE